MEINVQEIYQQTVRPLPERERLTLATLILQDISQHPPVERKGDIRKFFGTVTSGAIGLDNEQIDRDLAQEYGSTHEDED